MKKKLERNLINRINLIFSFFEIPVETYPSMNEYNLNCHIGIYDDVDDLLDNGKIEGISLRNIIASNETEILAID